MEPVDYQNLAGSRMTKKTDWDKYYQNPSFFAGITRKITQNTLCRTLKAHMPDAIGSICEFGGANSCIVQTICDQFSVGNYHLLDSNDYGLSLIKPEIFNTKISTELEDILNLKAKHDKKFDLVISIGLIEHFNEKSTQQAIANHFLYCKPGGIVLMTFPTPTFLYRLIRSIAEAFKVWSFPDERPLGFSEVLATAQNHGQLLHSSINWKIGLTQGIVLLQKSKEENHA